MTADRDIKSLNVMLDRELHCFIGDFGGTRALDSSADLPSMSDGNPDAELIEPFLPPDPVASMTPVEFKSRHLLILFCHKQTGVA